MQPATPDPNALMTLVVLVCIIAAIFDFIYWLRGGTRTPKPVARSFQAALILLVVAAGVMILLVGGGAAGTLTGMFSNVLFACWEYRRWRIRKKYPLGIAHTFDGGPDENLR